MQHPKIDINVYVHDTSWSTAVQQQYNLFVNTYSTYTGDSTLRRGFSEALGRFAPLGSNTLSINSTTPSSHRHYEYTDRCTTYMLL